jgi:predicted RNA-binding protein with PUA-like domain
MSAIWAFLADPQDYGWDQLVRDGSAVWDGIANAQAQRNLGRCATGDVVLIYHTAPDKALVGMARVGSPPRPDPNVDGRVVVDLEPVRPLARALPLAELKGDDVLCDMAFVRMPRVAVQPLTPAQLQRILAVSGTRA